MLLSWLSKFISTLLALLLFGIIVLGICTQTVFSSHYLEGKLTDVHGYSRLSVALSNELAQQNSGLGDPMLSSQVQSILTPTVLKQKINGALEQFEAYNRHGGPKPVIDLTDLAAKAQAAGLDVSADSNLNRPINLSGTEKLHEVSQGLKLAGYGTLVAVVILALALILICWHRRRFAALPDVLIWVGILTGLLALFFGLVPGVAAHFIKLGSNADSFSAIAQDLATNVSHDLGKRFGIVAAILLVIGITVRLWLRHRGKRASDTKPILERRQEPIAESLSAAPLPAAPQPAPEGPVARPAQPQMASLPRRRPPRKIQG